MASCYGTSHSSLFDSLRRHRKCYSLHNALTLLVVLLATGCASVPKDYPRTPSTAIDDYLQTPIGQFTAEAAAKHPGQSGFVITRRGHMAFTDRIALTELAEQSLDLQYYIWETDATGLILAERLLKAADRGVRVRVLVDDINLSGRDAKIAALDAHPHVEVRIFNPFANRNAHAIDFLVDLKRVNHRMHNKMMIVDNALAIVGGRNIANHYFGVDTDANFRDLDIAAAGPVVRDISNVFDYFWNGDWAVPIDALVERPYTEADLKKVRIALQQDIAAANYPYPLTRDVAELTQQLFAIRDHLVWAPAWIVWDDPAAIDKGIQQGKISKALFKKLDTLQHELLIEAAYFIPREQDIERAKRLREKGVRVRVLTNSLASNDVLAAHAGYAKHRRGLIESGVELYEMRPDAGTIKKAAFLGRSKAALHTKAMVFDRESVFIGSLNLDSRSAAINTEVGLYIESPELARQVIAYLDEGVLPENSYRVLLDDDGELVWVTRTDGHEVRYHKDPKTSFGQRMMTNLIMLLPIDDQL